MIFVITPPAVSMPKERGATSTKSTSLIFSSLLPVKTTACTAAPHAIASSGLIDMHSSSPLKNKSTFNRFQSKTEEIHTQFFKSRSANLGIEVYAIKQGINFDSSFSTAR
ncbi:UNVERIFIED_CONTAM: hypothetical protein NCL1_25389 [Trichonephila clavipes]